MPESKCEKCGLSFNAVKEIDLMRDELKHYLNSAKPTRTLFGAIINIHECTTFHIEGEKYHVRTYGGRWWQETNYGDFVDEGRISSLT